MLFTPWLRSYGQGRMIPWSSRFVRRISSAPPLRPYQMECIERCREFRAQGKRQQLVLLPVGSGKTLVMAHVIRQILAEHQEKKKVLVLAHRKELLDQIKSTLLTVDSSLQVSLDIADRVADVDQADVVLASVQTIGRQAKRNARTDLDSTADPRLLRYQPEQFAAIMVDEAHHAPAKSYLQILDHFGTREALSPCVLWGCTATPLRTDQANLLEVFSHVVYEKHILELMREGYLCPVIPVSIANETTVLPITEEDAMRHDFDADKLSQVVNSKTRNELILQAYQTHIRSSSRRSTLLFGCDLQHCDQLFHLFSEYFESEGESPDRVAIVRGTTDREEREQIVRRFREGEIHLLINCGVFTEGIDMPTIDSVIVARPTLSNILYYQMIGRGLRPSPSTGKKDCLVMDIVDKVESKFYSVVTTPTLFGLQMQESYSGHSILELQDRSRAEHSLHTIQPPTLRYLDVETSHPGPPGLLSDREVASVSTLEWQRMEDTNRFLLSSLQNWPVFGAIIVDRKRVAGKKKIPMYSWKEGYSSPHAMPTSFLSASASLPKHRYLYTARYLRKEHLYERHLECDVTTVAMSDQIEQVRDTAEQFVQENFPEAYEAIRKAAPWYAEPWDGEEGQLEGLAVPYDFLLDPQRRLTKGMVKFYGNKKKLKNIVAAMAHPLDEWAIDKCHELGTFQESPLDWCYLHGSFYRPTLPFHVQITYQIEVDEYLPDQFRVTLHGYTSRPLLIQPPGHASREENLKNAFQHAENYVKDKFPAAFKYKTRTSTPHNWKQQPASSKQLDKLNVLHALYPSLVLPSSPTKGEAALFIDSLQVCQRARFE